MITQTVLDFFRDLLANVVALLNFDIGVLDTVASWLTTGGSGASVQASSVSSMLDALWVVDPFVPRTAVLGALAIMLGLGTAMFVIWLVRFIISLVTGGGGVVA